MNDDIRFMDLAIQQAKQADAIGEVPVGAVIVKNGEVISHGYNRRETDKNALLHAEIIAIDAACKKLGGWRLQDCELFVTLEPCPMCCGAIIHARIKRVVFGAYDPKGGACGSITNLMELPNQFHPKVMGGVKEKECLSLMESFFKRLRTSSDKRKGGMAYCGLLCEECPVYLASQSNDEVQRERLAKMYSVPGCSFTKEDIVCEGCHATSSNKSKMCKDCPMRNCARNKGVKHCAACGKYPCKIVEQYLPPESEKRKRLDKLKKL